MGEVREVAPSLLLLAAFSRNQKALDWTRIQAKKNWGPVALTSPLFDFRETDYYEPTMGTCLKKIFYLFDGRTDPAKLAARKRQTNRWEVMYKKLGWDRPDQREVERPLNLDPGYLTEAKLVLASTKDHAHRIYLSRGIYAEVTLNFQNGGWQNQDWTYPDYRRDDYHQFFTDCRDFLRNRMSKGGTQ